MITIKLKISAFPTPEKFELYEWLDQQRWKSDQDYWMRFHGPVGKYLLAMHFEDHNKAALFKLAWNGR